jgi:membrane protease YdiL (CAAX protease family)
MAAGSDYLRATRHPWPCLLFLLPLLAAYELGVYRLGGGHPEALRNGADNWVRQGFAAVGLRDQFWTPGLLVLVLAVWNYRRREDRPGDLVGVLSGMAIESVAFALGLWGVSRGLGPLIDYFGLELNAGPSGNHAVGQVVTFLGAGLYEETLFRLLLFSGLAALLRRAGAAAGPGVALAALASAMLFSAAHHAGPYGEPFEGYNFLFRTIAGLYFALLYQWRGFGIAVGAHACYDVVVGVVVG